MSNTTSSEVEAPVYVLPEVELGDKVLFYNDPLNLKNPQLGFISRRPGKHTCYILVFTEASGFIEKPSVRHASDPGLQENPMWREWGCFALHPEAIAAQRFAKMLPRLQGLLDRQGQQK